MQRLLDNEVSGMLSFLQEDFYSSMVVWLFVQSQALLCQEDIGWRD